MIRNQQAFLQVSYAISRKKSHLVNDGCNHLVRFVKQEINYLFRPQQRSHLWWKPGECLESFEIGISTETHTNF